MSRRAVHLFAYCNENFTGLTRMTCPSGSQTENVAMRKMFRDVELSFREALQDTNAGAFGFVFSRAASNLLSVSAPRTPQQHPRIMRLTSLGYTDALWSDTLEDRVQPTELLMRWYRPLERPRSQQSSACHFAKLAPCGKLLPTLQLQCRSHFRSVGGQ